MKTLEELKSEIERYGLIMKTAGGGGHDGSGTGWYGADGVKDGIFKDLATLHALATMQAEALRAELEDLEQLRDGNTRRLRMDAACKPGCQVRTEWVAWPENPSELDATINAAGLARIAEIRALLGESEES